MSSQSNVTPGPIAPENNPPIEPQFYIPSRFVISSITYGPTTIVRTSTPHNYLRGQTIRMLIPQYYGANELNGMQGNVIAIPSDDEVVLNIISTGFTPFGFSGPTANITGISNSNPCVITASNYFYPGLDVLIANVRGTSQLNGNTYEILSNNATSLTIDVDSTSFGTYVSGGTATLITPEKNNVPQIIAIGDVNSGQINGNGLQTATFVPGSFINVS